MKVLIMQCIIVCKGTRYLKVLPSELINRLLVLEWYTQLQVVPYRLAERNMCARSALPPIVWNIVKEERTCCIQSEDATLWLGPHAVGAGQRGT